MKKSIIIYTSVFLVLIIVGVSIYFVHDYQYKGSVEYSISQLATAFSNQNTVLVAKYFDQDSVVNNFWNSYIGLSYAANQNAFTSAITDSQEKNTKSNMHNDWQKVFNSKTDNKTIYYALMQEFFADRNLFTINGGIASKKITYQRDNSVVYVFTFILTQQSDRTWKITDIQGLSDYMARFYADNTRVANLQTIKQLLVAYQNEYHTLPTVDLLESDLANTQFDIKYQLNQSSIGSILQDPLSNYGNKYIYAVDNVSIPKYFVVEAKISHDNTTLAAYSESTSTVYGVDCTFPSSFCVSTAASTGK